MQKQINMALNWIENDRVEKEGNLLSIIDKAFFYHMLLNRFPYSFEKVKWKMEMNHFISSANKIVDFQKILETSPVTFKEKYELCHLIDGLMMLGYLASKLKYSWYKEYSQNLREVIDKQKNHIFNISFLFNFSFDFLMRGQGLDIPKELVIKEDYNSLSPEKSFIIKSYYYTHIILFNTNFFAREIEDAKYYKFIIDYIKDSTDKVIYHGYTDLIGEFIWCLILCGEYKSYSIYKLLSKLIEYQNTEGFWTHESYDLKATRHATYVSTIALLMAKEAGVKINIKSNSI